MNDPLKLVMLVLAAAGLLIAAWLQRKSAAERARRRAAVLDDCKPIFSGGQKMITATGFPRIAGDYKGHTFDLQLAGDTLNMRKLPSLWLLVTLPEALPVAATFDLMMRPRGIEMFSKFAELPVQITPHDGFPHDCAIRTDNPAGLPPEHLLRRHAAILHDERVKELLITPKGVRIVWLAEEAHRGRYLIFRDSELGVRPVDPAQLAPLLDALIQLRNDIIATHETRHE